MTEWILAPLGWLFAWRPDWRDSAGRWLLRIGGLFYLLLAIAFALAGAWDQLVNPFSSALSNASFDSLMRHRPVAYRSDPDIVVLDIDEASLAALSGDYGRWPWPREVLARVAAKLESHNARAVVFDILFADPDIANPASEAAFDRYVSNSKRSFYPLARLNPQNDGASQVTVAMLNFAKRDPLLPPAQVNAAQTVAVLPPYFKSIYDSTRMGTHNVYPDEDNIVRWYPNYELLGGYRIPSLPYRMAEVLGWPLPPQSRNLLNWPRGLTPYRRIPFAAALSASNGGDEVFFKQFAGKVVVIGSTAPSLNDLKATPVDRLEPGVYVLATAIDNTKNGRFLHPLRPLTVCLIELLLLAASAHLFMRTERAQMVAARYFVAIPTALLGISLLSVSISDLLFDLSVPAAVVFSYFTIATVYEACFRDCVSGSGPFAATTREQATRRLQITSLPPSMTYSQVLGVLRRAAAPIRLWRPPELGLGIRWAAQGWVLWRWSAGQPGVADSPHEADTTSVPGLTLTWVDVALTGGPGGSFPLSHAISRTAAASGSHP